MTDRKRVRAVAVLALAMIVASCSGNSPASDDADPAGGTTAPTATSSTVSSTVVVPTTTIVTTTTSPPPPTYPFAVSVAFLDACVSTPDLAGACRCALDAFATAIAAEDLSEFAATATDSNQVSGPLQGAVARCAGATPAPASQADVAAFVGACSLGDDRLRDACTCAAERAQQIVPAADLERFTTEIDVVPDVVDLVNRCLTEG